MIILNQKRFRLLSLFMALSIVSGCAPRQAVTLQEPVLQEGMALLYLYRPASMSNVVISPHLKVDDMDDFAMENDSYTYVQLQPGPHRVRLLLSPRYQGDHEYSFSAQAGRRYYLRLDTALKFRKNELYERRFDLRPVSAAAQEEILRCSFFPIQGDMPLADQRSDDSTAPQAPVESEFSISKSRDPFSRGR